MNKRIPKRLMTAPVEERLRAQINTIGILQRATELGLKLGIEEPDTLTYEPIENCQSDFRETLRAHKPQLLALLRLPFVMVYSQILEETIFFCEDDATKEALIKAGAEAGAIYTRSELQILVTANRAKPFLPDELCKVHLVKKTFGARITGQDVRPDDAEPIDF